MLAFRSITGTTALVVGLALGLAPAALADEGLAMETDGAAVVSSPDQPVEGELGNMELGIGSDSPDNIGVATDETEPEFEPDQTEVVIGPDETEPVIGPDETDPEADADESVESVGDAISDLPDDGDGEGRVEVEVLEPADLPASIPATDDDPEVVPVATAAEEPGAHEEPDTHEDPDGHEDPGGHDPDAGGQPSRLSCAAIDASWVEFELKGHPTSGTYTIGDDFRTVQVVVHDAAAGGKYVNWSSNGPIDAVILRSGQDAATYEYEPAATGDTGLLPALKDREGRNLASILACYDPDEVVVGIDLFLADSDDPVAVGDTFDYVVAVDTTGPLTEAEVVVELAAEVELVEAPGCSVADGAVSCAPPPGKTREWTETITVLATTAGNAITSARLTAKAGAGDVTVSAVEVTRIIGAPGSGGGCGGHDGGEEPGHEPGGSGEDGEEPGHEPGGDGGDDECPGAAKALLAACAAVDPAATAVVLPGPFSSRQYLVEGPDGVRIWVTVGEGTGLQMASWEANVPIDLVLSRTGQDVAKFPNAPAAMAGTGVVGAPSGSGKPRPIADIAFCWVDRPPIDVAVTAVGPTGMTVGAEGVVEITIHNRGYSTTDAVSARVRTSAHVEAGMCTSRLGCPLVVGPGETTTLTVPVTGMQAGLAEVIVDVAVFAEQLALAGDNTVTVQFSVTAAPPIPGGQSDDVKVSPAVIAADVLPETGLANSLLQLIVGTALIALGSGLVRFGTPAGSRAEQESRPRKLGADGGSHARRERRSLRSLRLRPKTSLPDQLSTVYQG